MKNRKVKSIFPALLAVISLFSFSTLGLGQSLPEISVRFANPQYDQEAHRYTLDVEMRSNGGVQSLFGMNVRFFYDAAQLEYSHLDEFQPGYGILGDPPRAFQGSASSGFQLFGFPGAATYVNGAVQLLNDQSPLQLVSNQWVKVFRVCFSVPAYWWDETEFCPSLIWDIKPQARKGSFFRGSDGLVLTVLEDDPETPEVSAPAYALVQPFNWHYGSEVEMPYGQPQAEDCISLGQLVATDQAAGLGGQGYALWQNQPNPFVQSTLIEFFLPTAQEAKLSFFDITGRLVKEIQGNYQAGNNAIRLDRAVWMEQSNMILYRLETSDYISAMLKMTIINP
jgi:hypothetical protein